MPEGTHKVAIATGASIKTGRAAPANGGFA